MHEKFRAKRKEVNITLRQLAAAIEVSAATLSRFEQGKQDLPLKAAYNAAKILGMRLVLQ